MAAYRSGIMASMMVCAVAGGLTAPARAADTSPRKQQCIELQWVDETPVIDNRTILVRMKGRDDYRRIDLAAPCSGLKIQGGFAFDTSTNEICTSTPLRVLEPVGSVCMIKQIVTITPDEAKALLARR